MGRILPWVLIAVAVAATLALALPMLLGPGDAGGSPGLERGREETGGPTGARLLGTGTEPTRRAPVGGRYRIRGTVLEERGEPLAGIRVTVQRAAHQKEVQARLRRKLDTVESGRQAPLPILAEAVSDEEGAFSFAVADLGSHRVRAHPAPPRCGSHTSAWLSRDRDEAEVTLRVLEAAELRGRVVDAGGAGVHAIVRATTVVKKLGSFETAEKETAATDGTFRLEGMPVGTWRVTVRIPGQLELTGVEVEVPHDGVWELRLGDATGSIAGRVRDLGDDAIAAAEILLHTRQKEAKTRSSVRATTDVDGRYRVPLVPIGEIVEVGILSDGFLPTIERPPLARWSGARVVAGEETTLDLVLRQGTTLEGRVFDLETKAPLAGADVRVCPPHVPGRSNQAAALEGRSGDDGRFRIEGIPPGKHLLLALHATHYLPALVDPPTRTIRRQYVHMQVGVAPPESILIVPRRAGHLERDVGLSRGAGIRGVVLDPDGAPCPGARIEVSGVSRTGETWTLGFRPPSDIEPWATSDEQGRFEILNLPPRPDAVLLAVKKPFQPVLSEPIALERDARAPEVELRLEAGTVLAGRVLGPDGRGVRIDVSVYPTSPRHGRYDGVREESNAEGAFRLEGAPTGDVRVQASDAERGLASHVEKGLEAGEVREGLELRLERGVRVTGRVVDADGEPQARLSLTVGRPDGSSQKNTTTDEEGRFTFPNAPEGKVQIQVYRSHGGYGMPVDLGKPFESPADDVELVFRPTARAVVEGMVRGPAGAPVPLCRVTVEGRRQNEFFYGGMAGTFQAEEVVDGWFRREVEGAPPYTILVSEARDASGRPLNLESSKTTIEDASAGPVEIELETGHEIEGRVVDPNDVGLEGVLVSAANGATFTDAEGRFRLRGLSAGGTSVRAEAPEGYVDPDAVAVGSSGGEVLIRLERALGIAGVVRGPDEKPRANAWIQAEWVAPDGRSGSTSTQSEASGRFHLEGLPEGAKAKLTAHVWADGAQLAPAVLKDVLAGTRNLVLQVGGGVSIRGRVVDHLGNPLTDVHVTAWPAGEESMNVWNPVQDDGTFEIGGLEPGPYRLGVYRDNGAVPAAVETPAPAEGVIIRIPESRTIAGRLNGDAPLDGFSIRAELLGGGPMSHSISGRSQGDGTFEIEGAGDGRYKLRVTRNDDDRYGLVDGVAGGDANVVIPLVLGHALGGRLDLSNGDSVESGWIWAQGEGFSRTTRVKEGLFEIHGLPPGRYELQGAVQEDAGGFGGWQKLGEHESGSMGLRLRLK